MEERKEKSADPKLTATGAAVSEEARKEICVDGEPLFRYMHPSWQAKRRVSGKQNKLIRKDVNYFLQHKKFEELKEKGVVPADAVLQ